MAKFPGPPLRLEGKDRVITLALMSAMLAGKSGVRDKTEAIMYLHQAELLLTEAEKRE